MFVIPTFTDGTKEIVKTPSGIASYLIYFFFTNPGDISTTFPDLISFRKLHAQLGNSSAMMCTAIQTMFQDILNEHFPDSGITVEVTEERVTDTTFKLLIKIRDRYQSYLIDPSAVTVDGDDVTVNPN